jgi:hypothetical protein
MFAANDAGKFAGCHILRACAQARDAIWLDQFITILSGR